MYQGLHMDIFIRELKSLLSSIIVKRTILAKEYETLDTIRDSEMYIMVREGTDDFSSYNNFEPGVYKRAGVPEADMYTYMKDKNAIPFGLRGTLLKFQRQAIISSYEEKNNYYLMLNGKPDYGDTDFIYAPENSLGVPTNIPIHQLTQAHIERLRAGGVIKDLMAKHPDKKYLKYLGIYSIDIYTARRALNYELLYCGNTNPSNIGLNFRRYYANAREYYMVAIYNSNTAHGYEYYDNFLGLCILVMAVQRLFASVFEQGITRDFYDVQLVRYLFDSYSIPFIEDMTLDQMKLLAKNLNIFLMYKSSNKVIFDLCSIFGFSNVNIYKYLLVRDHVKDSVTGKPIFPMTTISNGDGTYSTVPDYKKMYDIYFQKVNIESKDVSAALVDKANMVDYKSLTVGDIYWVDDEELRDRLYKAGMNYIESKYLSMDIMFKITEMMYEICHFFRMVIDNNSEFKKVYLLIPKVSSLPQNLYSVIIFICALWCKRYGFTGEIPLKPASIAYVYGFNFHTDIGKLIDDIISSKYIDDDVVKYLLNFTVASNKDVDRIYGNIKGLKDFCTEQMAATKNIEVYRAYKALYNSALVVEDREEMYAKDDGTYAETYADLLKNINPELYAYLDQFDVSDTKMTESIMEHILYRMEDLSERLIYLHTAVDSTALIRVLVRLINFFKSYTVDLTHCGILYLFDDRFLNMLKILDGIHSVEVKMWQDDGFLKMYYDAIQGADIKLNRDESIKVLDDWYAYVYAAVMDKLFLGDNLFAQVLKPTESHMLGEYSDTMDLEMKFADGEHIKLVDEIAETIIKACIEERIDLKEYLSPLVVSDVSSRVMGEYADNVSILTEMPLAGKIILTDRIVDIFIKDTINEYLHLNETVQIDVLYPLQTKGLLAEYSDHVNPLISKNADAFIGVLGKLRDFHIVVKEKVKVLLKEKLSAEILAKIQTNNVLKYSDDLQVNISRQNNDYSKFADKLADRVIVPYLKADFSPEDEISLAGIRTTVRSALDTQDVLGGSVKVNIDEKPRFEDGLVDIISKVICHIDSPAESKLSMRDELKIITVGE